MVGGEGRRSGGEGKRRRGVVGRGSVLVIATRWRLQVTRRQRRDVDPDAAVAGIPYEEDDARAHTRTHTHAHADARTRTRRRTKTHTHALMSDRSNIVNASPRKKRHRVAGRSTLPYRNSECRIQHSLCRDG